MCGIAGIYSHKSVATELYESIIHLQHRGQDAAGIMTYDTRMHKEKGMGLAKEVFNESNMELLTGNIGISHNRYPTHGGFSHGEVQPFWTSVPYGIALAHNGNLTNYQSLAEEITNKDSRYLNTNSDSEVLLNVFAHELQVQGKLVPTHEEIFKAVKEVHKRCKGGYAVIAMITGYGVLAFRDPHGIRPVCYGKRETDLGTEYMISSESVALGALGFELVRDIAPGEAVYIENDGKLYTEQCAENPQLNPCLFEHVYFARPDSIIDNISVYKARLRMGEKLAQKVKKLRPEHDIDVVMPIPDTSRTSAMEMAFALGVKFREGFIKNRYIGRTFIMPGQSERKKSVRQKLNPIELEFKDKNVMLVDDSIVRGTTCREIVQMARDAGAKNVYFASAAPEVRYPNVYGIDMPAKSELIAHNKTVEEIKTLIGADWLVYQDLDDLIQCAKEGNEHIEAFDCSVFNGEYVTGDISEAYLERLEQARNDTKKNKQNVEEGDESVIDLHNDA